MHIGGRSESSGVDKIADVREHSKMLFAIFECDTYTDTYKLYQNFLPYLAVFNFI
jgi:hypothetical protein